MKVLIIIPAYNEAQTLIPVMEHLMDVCPAYDYVIVNDGSIDETKNICEEQHYHAIHLPLNQGLTNAVRTGMQYALEHGYDMALQFDADGQHLPEYIEKMVMHMEESGCDIVIASRFVGMKMPIRLRTVGGKMITAAIRLTTGQTLTDPTSGMRLYKNNIIRMFLEHPDFAPEPDTVAHLMRLGADVQEVKVTMHERTEGQSYLTPVNATKYMIRVLTSILFRKGLHERKKRNRTETSAMAIKGKRMIGL